MTVLDELTMMPMKLTMMNPNGIAMSCGKPAALGVVAREAKSGALTARVAMLEMQDIRETTIAQPSSEPFSVAGWWMIGPTPLALTITQMKNVKPAIGTKIALAVKRWRLTG